MGVFGLSKTIKWSGRSPKIKFPQSRHEMEKTQADVLATEKMKYL